MSPRAHTIRSSLLFTLVGSMACVLFLLSDAGRLGAFLAGASAMAAFHQGVVLLVEIIPFDRFSWIAPVIAAVNAWLARWFGVALASAAGLGTIALIGYWSWQAAWFGVLLTIAILIPVLTITFVLGGHKPVVEWFYALRRKT